MNEFVISDGNVVLNTAYAEAYIPEELFKDIEKESEISSAVAYESGEAIITIGVFNMRFMPSDEEDRSKFPLRTFNYPSPIEIYPTSVSNKNLSLNPEDEPEQFRVLHFYRGDVIMAESSRQASDNCEKFLNMMTRGKIPSTIPYKDLLTVWRKNFAINGLDPGVPSVTMQSILSIQCRDRSNPEKEFRKTIGLGKGGNYELVNMRKVASYTSVFNALTFEDMGAMLTTSLNMSRNNVEQSVSPVEKVLSM